MFVLPATMQQNNLILYFKQVATLGQDEFEKLKHIDKSEGNVVLSQTFDQKVKYIAYKHH